MNEKQYNVLLHILGSLMIASGGLVLVTNYANPIFSGISFITFGILCILSKYSPIDRE